MTLSRLVVVSTLFAPLAGGQGKVWIVDAAGGGDFLTVQEAVDAAFQGNSILVRPGSYPEWVTIPNKALQLVADTGPTPHVHGLTLRDHAPNRDVYVAGLDLWSLYIGWWNSTMASDAFVEGCTSAPPLGYSQDAVVVLGPATRGATFVNCHALGGTECDWTTCGPDIGGMGYALSGEHAFVYFGSGIGGRGGTYADGFCTSGWENPGGYGALVSTPYFYSSHCHFEGGWGGQGEGDPNICICGGGCSANSQSPGVVVEPGGNWVQDATPLTRLRIPNLLREGEAFEVRVVGPAGAAVYLLESDEQDVVPLGPDVGVLHLGLSYVSVERHLGTISPNGNLTVPATAPTMPEGTESRMRYFQVIVDDGTSAWLSNPTGSLLVDESF